MTTIAVPSPGDPVLDTWGAQVAEAINGTTYDQRFLVGAIPWGLHITSASETSSTLAAVSGSNAGIALIPFQLPGPLKLTSIIIRNTDAASARSAEGRLYYSIGTGVLQYVTGTAASWSFTPVAESDRSANISVAGTLLIPGCYWLAIRNTSGSQTFGLARTANTELSSTYALQDTTAAWPALGSTLTPGAMGGAGGQFFARLVASSYL